MGNRLMLLIAMVAGIVALVVGVFADTQYQLLVATVTLPVPAVEIPPYTIVSPTLFELKSFPKPMAQEAVYRTLEETAGKITTITLAPGQLVYLNQLVSPKDFRFTDDERLEIVSFPIHPEQAAGGQIKAGQRINIYRVALQAQAPSAVVTSPDPQIWLRTPGAGVELLVPNAPVVDVRSSQGSPMAPPPRVQSSASEVTNYQTADTASATNQPRPLTILTVAVPPDTAKDIIRLAGESGITARFLMWVSLAPTVESKAGK